MDKPRKKKVIKSGGVVIIEPSTKSDKPQPGGTTEKAKGKENVNVSKS